MLTKDKLKKEIMARNLYGDCALLLNDLLFLVNYKSRNPFPPRAARGVIKHAYTRAKLRELAILTELGIAPDDRAGVTVFNRVLEDMVDGL